MQRCERVGAEGQLFGLEERGGKRLAGVADERERLGAELAQLLLREVLGCRVDGSEVGGLGLALEVVRADGEAELVRAAA